MQDARASFRLVVYSVFIQGGGAYKQFSLAMLESRRLSGVPLQGQPFVSLRAVGFRGLAGPLARGFPSTFVTPPRAFRAPPALFAFAAAPFIFFPAPAPQRILDHGLCALHGTKQQDLYR